VTQVDGRLFWSARLPSGEGGTRAVAYDASGAVLGELDWPPPPKNWTPPAGEPELLMPECATMVDVKTGVGVCAPE
jgi:hypothetical protein